MESKKKVKKSIRPISILRIVWLSIWLIFICASISAVIIISLDSEYDVIGILSLIFSVIMFLISLIIFCFDFKKGVKFEESSLKVASDIADKKGLLIRRFQHSLEVRYEDIQKLYLKYSSNDSNDEQVSHVFIAMPYIVMDCRDGSKQAINVYYYNKKQRTQIVAEIILRAKRVGNLIECEAVEYKS